MNNELKHCIISGEFEQAEFLVRHYTAEEIDEILVEIAYTTVSLNVYTLLLNILLKDQKAAWHFLISKIFLVSLCDLKGSYFLGLFHLRRAIEFEPNELRFQQFLIAYHHTPDRVVTAEEAISVAKRVLIVNPQNKLARNLLQEYHISFES